MPTAHLAFGEGVNDGVAHHIGALLPHHLGGRKQAWRRHVSRQPRQAQQVARSRTSPVWLDVKYQKVGSLYLYTTWGGQTPSIQRRPSVWAKSSATPLVGLTVSGSLNSLGECPRPDELPVVFLSQR